MRIAIWSICPQIYCMHSNNCIDIMTNKTYKKEFDTRKHTKCTMINFKVHPGLPLPFVLPLVTWSWACSLVLEALHSLFQLEHVCFVHPQAEVASAPSNVSPPPVVHLVHQFPCPVTTTTIAESEQVVAWALGLQVNNCVLA